MEICFFLVNRAAIRGIIIGVILSFLTQLCGASTFVTYAAVIFKSVGGSNIDPFIGSITIAVVQILGSLFTTQLSDRLGRKFLVLVSLFGSSIGLILFAFYLYLNDNGYDLSSFEWVPVTCLSFVIFIASAGIIPLALVCTVENLPSKVSDFIIIIIHWNTSSESHIFINDSNKKTFRFVQLV